MTLRVHDLKTWPAPFSQVLNGRKTFEIRKDDRGFKVGDVLRLREWQPREDHPDGGWYTGRECWREVTYMTCGGEWGLPPGLCVMALGAGPEVTP
jgi:hypothetical protein